MPSKWLTGPKTVESSVVFCFGVLCAIFLNCSLLYVFCKKVILFGVIAVVVAICIWLLLPDLSGGSRSFFLAMVFLFINGLFSGPYNPMLVV